MILLGPRAARHVDSCLRLYPACCQSPSAGYLGTIGGTRLEQVFPTSSDRKYQRTKQWAKPGPKSPKDVGTEEGGGSKGWLNSGQLLTRKFLQVWAETKGQGAADPPPPHPQQVNSPFLPWSLSKNDLMMLYVQQLPQADMRPAFNISKWIGHSLTDFRNRNFYSVSQPVAYLP